MNNSGEMSLSIIIPTLNEENYVGKLLDCLCRQTYKDFEVIVVDGNSRDKTISVVEKFRKKLNLRLIKSERGVSLQRNVGAKHSKYDRLVFFDADITFNDLGLK